MSDKKAKLNDTHNKKKPSASNDQLGENAGEGRFERFVETKNSKGKCR